MCIAHTFAFMTFCVHCYQAEVMNVALICFHLMQGWIKFHHMAMVRNTALACVFFFWKLAACINDVSWCIYRNQTFAESIYSNMSILASSLIDTNMKVILVYSKMKQSCLSFTSVSNQDRFQLEIRSQCPLTGTLWSNNTIFHAVSSLCEGWWEMRLPRSCADCHWRSFFGHNLPFQKPHFD